MTAPSAKVFRALPESTEPRLLAPPAASAAPSPIPAKGFDQGYREGQQAARREAEQLLEAAQAKAARQLESLSRDYAHRIAQADTLIAALTDAQASLARSQEHAVVSLAYEALLRILHDAHAQRPLVARIVTQTLRNQVAGGVCIRLHPQDLEQLSVDAEMKSLLLERDTVSCLADDTLQPGDCLIDTSQGTQDLSLATQLHRLTQAWLAALGEPAASPRATAIGIEAGER